MLSEFAGAAAELRDAFLVNPHDVDGLKDTLLRALEADPDDLRARMAAMREQLHRHDILAWARDYLTALASRGEVHVVRADADRLDLGVVEHLAFPRGRQDVELVAEVAADRPGVGRHRHRLHAQAPEGAQVGQHHDPVGAHRGSVVQVEGIAVLHQELPPAHHAEAGPGLIAELPLDMIQDLRQLAVAADRLAQQVGDQQLVGGAVDQVPVVPVLEAQHLRAVGVVAPGGAPQVGGLQRGHQQFLRADAVLLFPHHLRDVAQHAPACRKPRVDARRHLTHQPGPQHEPMRGDLRFRRDLLDGGQQGAGQAHQEPVRSGTRRTLQARRCNRQPPVIIC